MIICDTSTGKSFSLTFVRVLFYCKSFSTAKRGCANPFESLIVDLIFLKYFSTRPAARSLSLKLSLTPQSIYPASTQASIPKSLRFSARITRTARPLHGTPCNSFGWRQPTLLMAISTLIILSLSSIPSHDVRHVENGIPLFRSQHYIFGYTWPRTLARWRRCQDPASSHDASRR